MGHPKLVSQETVEFIRLGYRTSLEFRTDTIADWPTAVAAIHAIGGYNRFDPCEVAAAIKPLFPKLMGIQVGRDDSPVVYLELPYWTHQRTSASTRGEHRQYTIEERKKLAEVVMAAMRAVQADAVSDTKQTDEAAWGKVSENPRMIRAWWD